MEQRVPPAVPIVESQSNISTTTFIGRTWEERRQFLTHARDMLQRDDPLQVRINAILVPAKWSRILKGGNAALDAEVKEVTVAAWTTTEAQKDAESQKRVRATEEYRRQLRQRMERHLEEAPIAWEDLGTLKALFEEAYKNNAELCAQVFIDGPAVTCELGDLEFRQLATHAAGRWESWLDLVVGYLLEEDHKHEYIEKLSAETASGMPDGAESKKGENYTIHRLLKASALCCSWLMRREELRAERHKGKRSVTRQGYRAEIREWMNQKGIRNNAVAARSLAVGVSTLKSVMSTKGRKRYSDETLKRILDQIDLKQ